MADIDIAAPGASQPALTAALIALLTQTITTDATTARTLALGDASVVLKMTSGSANNITVPANATVAFPVGTTIHAVMYGAGQTAFVAAGGVTINPASTLKIDGQYTMATLMKTATNEWLLVGKLMA